MFSLVNAVFDFNASHTDVTPMSFMSATVDKNETESEWLMGTLFSSHVYHLDVQYRLSLVIVVFVFNDSLNNVAPLSLIWLSVDCIWKENKKYFEHEICVIFVRTTQI